MRQFIKPMKGFAPLRSAPDSAARTQESADMDASFYELYGGPFYGYPMIGRFKSRELIARFLNFRLVIEPISIG